MDQKNLAWFPVAHQGMLSFSGVLSAGVGRQDILSRSTRKPVMGSLVKKRRRKMSRHKYRKRRKANRHKNKK